MARGGGLTVDPSIAENANEKQFAPHLRGANCVVARAKTALARVLLPDAAHLGYERDVSRTAPNRAERAAHALVALVIAVFAVLALARPREDFDLFAYVGVVHGYDGADGARDRTLHDLRASLSDERFDWMTGRHFPGSYAHAMASDDRVFLQQLVWFRGRPLFTRAAWALSRAGVTVPRALHLVAWLSTIAVALLVHAGTAAIGTSSRRPWLRAGIRIAIFACVAALFHLDELAASGLSDPLGAALVLASFVLVFVSESPRAGLVLSVVAVLARSDAALYTLALAAFVTLVLRKQKGFGPFVGQAWAAVVVAFVLRFVVERGSYGWGALVRFRRVHPEILPADAGTPLDLATYLGIVRTWAFEVYACEVVALVALVALVAFPRGRRALRDPLVLFGALMIPLSLVRFLAFPDWDYRFFVAPLGFFFVALARAAGLAIDHGSRETGVPSGP